LGTPQSVSLYLRISPDLKARLGREMDKGCSDDGRGARYTTMNAFCRHIFEEFLATHGTTNQTTESGNAAEKRRSG